MTNIIYERIKGYKSNQQIKKKSWCYCNNKNEYVQVLWTNFKATNQSTIPSQTWSLKDPDFRDKVEHHKCWKSYLVKKSCTLYIYSYKEVHCCLPWMTNVLSSIVNLFWRISSIMIGTNVMLKTISRGRGAFWASVLIFRLNQQRTKNWKKKLF